MGQHCTAENPIQCCQTGSRQLCIRKNPGHCRLNTLGVTFCRPKPYTILSKRFQITLHKKIQCNFALILDNITQVKTLSCCLRGSRQLCIRKLSHSMLRAYAVWVLCNFVPVAPSNISLEKIQAIHGMLFD